MTDRLRRGANAMEFALTAPIFFLLFLGLADYGWLYASQAGLDNATGMACRDGSLADPARSSPVSVAKQALAQRTSVICTDERCAFDVRDLRSGNFAVPNRTLECTVTMDYHPLIGLVRSPEVISSTSYHRLEWQR